MRLSGAIGASGGRQWRLGVASVDVVVPSYQYGRYLQDCVTSVLTQGIADLRVLIIDNASTDGSVEIARQLAAEDRRVEVLARPRNLGPHASYNEGIDWAQADYFLILCADDYLLPGSLGRALRILEDNPGVNLVYGDAPFISASGYGAEAPAGGASFPWRVVPGASFVERLCRTALCDILGPTAVVRTSVQKRIGHYRETLPHTDDVEMWMRFACTGALAKIDMEQAAIRIHDSNRSRSLDSVHLWNCAWEAAFNSFFSTDGAALPNARRLHRLAKRTLAERAYWCAASHLVRGDVALARDLIRFSFRLAPSTAVLPPLSALLRRPDTLERLGRLSADLTAPLRRRFNGIP